jgi:hypothetical protein
MKPILVAKDFEYQLYGTQNHLMAGEYIIYSNSKVDNDDKLKFKDIVHQHGKGFIHAKRNNIYYVLLPNYEYLYRYFNGYEYRLQEEIDNSYNPEVIKRLCNQYSLKEWQKNTLMDIYSNLSKNLKYKKGLNVPVGAGKTLIALILSEYARLENKTCLMLTEKHLITTVEYEAKQWKLSSPTTLINYANLGVKKSNIQEKYDIVIVDECLKFKSGNTKDFMKLRKLCDMADIVICCTGTITSGRDIADLSWLNLLGDIVPNIQDTWMFLYGLNVDIVKFSVRVNATDHMGNRYLKDCLVTKVTCETWNFDTIFQLISPYLISPIIQDIKLPNLQEETIYFNKPSYYGTVKAGLYGCPPGSNFYQLVEATAGFVTNAKGETIALEKNQTMKMTWILNWLQDNPNKQLLVFSFYVYEQELFSEFLKKNNITYCFNTGKKKTIDKFISKKARVLICSSQMTEGMNLQYNVDTCIFLSFSWHPVKLVQGIGRVCRQGQPSPYVKVYYLLCQDTLDTKVLNRLGEHIKILKTLNTDIQDNKAAKGFLNAI